VPGSGLRHGIVGQQELGEFGLFARATWLRRLGDAGFAVERLRRPIGDRETDEVFPCLRPLGAA